MKTRFQITVPLLVFLLIPFVGPVQAQITSKKTTSTVKPSASPATTSASPSPAAKPTSSSVVSPKVSPSATTLNKASVSTTKSTALTNLLSPFTEEERRKIAIIRSEMPFLSHHSDSYALMVFRISSFHPSDTFRDRLQAAVWKHNGEIKRDVFVKNYRSMFGTGNPCDVFGQQALEPFMQNDCDQMGNTDFWILGLGNDPYQMMKDAGFTTVDQFKMCDAATGQEMALPGAGTPGDSVSVGGAGTGSGGLTGNQGAGKTGMGGMGSGGGLASQFSQQGGSLAVSAMGGTNLAGMNLFTSCGRTSMGNQGGSGSSCSEKTDGTMDQVRQNMVGRLADGGGGSSGGTSEEKKEPWYCIFGCEGWKAEQAAQAAKEAAAQTERQMYEDVSQKTFDKAVNDAQTALDNAEKGVKAAEEAKKQTEDLPGSVGKKAAQKQAEDDLKKAQEERDKAKTELEKAKAEAAKSEQAKKEKAEREKAEAEAKKAEEEAKKKGSGDCLEDIGCGHRNDEMIKAQMADICARLQKPNCMKDEVDQNLKRKFSSYPAPDDDGTRDEGDPNAPRRTQGEGVVDPWDENSGGGRMAIGIDPCGNMRQMDCTRSMPSPDGFDPCTPGPRAPMGGGDPSPNPLPVGPDVTRVQMNSGSLQKTTVQPAQRSVNSTTVRSRGIPSEGTGKPGVNKTP